MQEAVNEALPRFFSEAVDTEGFRAIGRPEVDVTAVPLEDGQDLEFTVETDVRPVIELPESEGIAVEVDEVTLQGEVKRIFTGWMFAASPGLHGVEHPIYDVWLSDCKSPPPVTAAIEPSVTAVAQPLKPPPLPPRRPAQFR